MKKRALLVAKHSVIEPLGLLYLSGVAEEEGWDCKFSLIEKDNFATLREEIKEYNPKLIGFTIYTGNHLSIFKYLDQLRIENPEIDTIVGGPHATYFPEDSVKHADYVVLSEGFNAFREILKGNAKKGIMPLKCQEEFPTPNRRRFYEEHEKHNKSPIKSVITTTGCPYKCTYCYNSSSLEDIADSLSQSQINIMEKSLGTSKRLFPKSKRTVDSIMREIENIQKVSPNTKMIYFQDDVFGANLDWIKEFNQKYSNRLPFHAQMRFEFANPKKEKNKERLERMREAGCTGLTFAIESADGEIREKVLNRKTDEELMYGVFEFLNSLDYKVRTEQMLGLPCGATENKTEINLEQDLKILALNVKLKEETNLPTMAWASIFAPYNGTKLYNYCQTHGFYKGLNNDTPDTFFEKSILRFPKEWVGPSLNEDKKKLWLPSDELENYRDRMYELRNMFSIFALLPKGDKLARDYLKAEKSDTKKLGDLTRKHLYDHALYKIN
jgi:anaerobic magnesium-protoporphyrin IX monomethyl ester cyclase